MCRQASPSGGAPALWLAFGLLAGCGVPDESFDRAALEQTEDRTEALANDLLAMSVALRDGDLEAAAAYFADRVRATPLPAQAPPVEPLVKWIARRSWSLPAETAETDRAEFLEELGAFLGRFRTREDVRFKVKAAHFNDAGGSAGEGHLKFFVVGRDEQGRREWLKGEAAVAVQRSGDGPWRIGRLAIEKLESKVALEELFSEVALPAGVATLFPAFGVGANRGFVSHGVAVADVNGDGLLDAATTGVERNALYLNLGDGRFRDAGDESLVAYAPPGSGALFLDHDNDGDPDLFLAAVGEQILLENRWIPDGRLQFRDVSAPAGVDRPAIGFSAVAADANADGLTDVYVCSYNRYGEVMPNSWIEATNGTPNLLLLNRGDGRFEEVAADWGVDDSRWSYAAGFVDVDEDGDQDLYVANDFGEDGFFRNDGARFRDVARELGVLDPGFGMGVSFGDYDNDGRLDLHVTNMSSTAGNRILKLLYPEQHEVRRSLDKQAAGNSLYRNAGPGGFVDVTATIGGLSGGWGFGGGFIDFDNDGWSDLYTPNGFVSGKTMKDT